MAFTPMVPNEVYVMSGSTVFFICTGYVQLYVSPNNEQWFPWENLPEGMHIRQLPDDGWFKRGGEGEVCWVDVLVRAN